MDVSAKQRSELDVREVDPLQEARVLMAYGRTREAAKVLNWHVKSTPADTAAFMQLLQLYFQMDDVESYSGLLDLGLRQAKPRAFIRAGVLAGVKKYPDALPLRRLATRLKVDLPPLSSAKQRRAPAPSPERPRSAERRKMRRRAAPRARPAPPASPDALDENVLLVRHVPPLDGLLPREAYTLCMMNPDGRLRQLRLGACTHPLRIRRLEAAVASAPGKLANYVDLLLLHAELGHAAAYSKWLWRVFWLVGDKERRLRENLLEIGGFMGSTPLLDGLRAVLEGRDTLNSVALQLHAQPYLLSLQQPCDLVTERREPPDAKRESQRLQQRALLKDLRTMISDGATGRAMDILEGALLSDPNQTPFYPLLLKLYEVCRAAERFKDFEFKILTHKIQPPLEIVLKIIDTGKRLGGGTVSRAGARLA